MFQKIIILVTVIASSLRINGEVLHNDDFTELSAIFITQKSRRVSGEETLIETNILSFEKCLYSCNLYLKCGFVDYHEDQKVCELLSNVTTTKIEGGWLTSRATNGTDLVSGSFPLNIKSGVLNRFLLIQSKQWNQQSVFKINIKKRHQSDVIDMYKCFYGHLWTNLTYPSYVSIVDSKQVTSCSLDAAVSKCSNSKKTCNIYSTKCLLNSEGVVDSVGWVVWVECVCVWVSGWRDWRG